MSHYYCSEHGDDPDASCVACDAARDWIDKDERISELTVQNANMQEHLTALEAENKALRQENAELHGFDNYAQMKSLLKESSDG